MHDNTLPDCGLWGLVADTVANEVLTKKLHFTKEEWKMLTPVLPDLVERFIAIAGVHDNKDQWSRKARLAYEDWPCSLQCEVIETEGAT